MSQLTKAQLAQLVEDYAYGYGIDPAVALVQMQRESAYFRPDVVYGNFVGGSGERGMAQFTPDTWQRFGNGPHTNAYDPDYSLTAWGNYMSFLLNRYGYDYTKALQAYNGGEGNVDRGTVSQGAQKYAREILAKAGMPQASGSAGGGAGAGNPPPDDNSGIEEYLPYILAGGAVLLILLVAKK